MTLALSWAILPYVIENERREYQRLRLIQPIEALFDDQTGLILDLGITGALVEHYGELTRGTQIMLRFQWKAYTLEFSSSAMRSIVLRPASATATRPSSQTGVRFDSAKGDSEEHLREMLATIVGKVIAAQRANARGDFSQDLVEGQAILADLGQARRGRSRAYTSYRLRGFSWWRFPTDSPVQPIDGFTVADYEDEEELTILCRTYEKCNEEGRRLIRLIGELSAQTVKNVGPMSKQLAAEPAQTGAARRRDR